MKDMLKYIPGFRSNVTWKKIVASIYYIFTLLMMTVGFDFFLFFLAMPFFIFAIASLINLKKNNKSIKIVLLVLIVSLGTMIGSLGYTDSADEVMKIPEEPSDIELEKEDEKEITKKREEREAKRKAKETKRKEEEAAKRKEEEAEKKKEEITKKEEEEKSFEEVHNLKVHYLDVGQGDSIFIELPNGETVLIDGGTRSNGSIVLNYLDNLKIKNIDYLVATHPHEDHIGGLIQVINQFDTGKIYMPGVTHTTKTFEDLLLAIKNKDKKIITANAGDIILDKEGLSLKIIAPETNHNGSNLNNHSVVVKLNYKSNNFIFIGDAEKEAESSMVNSGWNLKSDVLKIGHHGSNTSTTDSFLNEVNPKFAVISCGIDNTYNHPNDETINKLNAKGVKIFRTDLDGTIIATANGKEITFNKKASRAKVKKSASSGSSNKKEETSKKTDTSKKKKEEVKQPEPEPEPKPPKTDNVEEVYITNTGSKYHRGGCRYLKKSKIPISLKKAKENYEPCKACKPQR